MGASAAGALTPCLSLVPAVHGVFSVRVEALLLRKTWLHGVQEDGREAVHSRQSLKDYRCRDFVVQF